MGRLCSGVAARRRERRRPVLLSPLLLAAAAWAPAAISAEEPQRPKSHAKIEHFVTLLLENRAWDHVFGCFGLKGADGIPPEGRVLFADPANKSAGKVTVSCGTAPYICSTDPLKHNTPATYPHYVSCRAA